MSISGYATFMGIDHSRFSQNGALVSYNITKEDGFNNNETEDQRKSINFALVGPGDLKPRGIKIENSLDQNSLKQNLETFNIVIHYSDDLYTFIKQDKKIKMEWESQLYDIQAYDNKGGHKVYIELEIVKRDFKNG